MQKFIRRDSSPFEKLNAMLERSAQTISSKYYILLFPLNLIIEIIVILLVYSTVCSDIIVLHQARGYSWLKVHFFQIVVIIRLNGTGISNLNCLFIQEMKSSGATVGLR